ncbi:MAG: hypothetical protein JSS81_11565 [Acidobacteria bacterium]|nr:hypothetical protein [Acidobacteriota bacterium]
MAKKIYPSNDAEFAVWMANLVNKAGTYKSELKMTDAELDELQHKLASFNANVALKQQKRDEASAQITRVKRDRTELNRDVGTFNNAVKAIKGLPDHILEELGLSPDGPHFGGSGPVQPRELVVTGTVDGTHRLKWRRGDSQFGTVFIIEAKTGDAGVWTMIDAVTNSSYLHRNQRPGVKIQYRVKAKRGDAETGYTNTAGVYD